MLKELFVRLKQGYKTIKYPAGKPPVLPKRLRGQPVIEWNKCKSDCSLCSDICPTGAIARLIKRLT